MPDAEPHELIAYNYWIIVVHLVKRGISWEALKSFSSEDMAMILGVMDALQERENEQQETLNRMASPRI